MTGSPGPAKMNILAWRAGNNIVSCDSGYTHPFPYKDRRES